MQFPASHGLFLTSLTQRPSPAEKDKAALGHSTWVSRTAQQYFCVSQARVFNRHAPFSLQGPTKTTLIKGLSCIYARQRALSCLIDAFPYNGPGTSNGARPAGRDRVLDAFACRMSASRRKKRRKTLTFLV